MLLVRQDDEDLMRSALEWRGTLIYLIDDDIAGAASSSGLPDDYRRRLARFDASYHRPLLQRAEIVVTPSEALAARLRDDGLVAGQSRLIDPYWKLPLANQDHFSGLPRSAMLRIAHLGSGSHGAGLRAITPAIVSLLKEHANISFTYIAKEMADPALANHPRAHRLSPLRWPRYRRWLAGQRFHLALYPLDAQRFDGARSMNKLIEHAIVGAVGMYPSGWAQAGRLEGAALTAPDDPAHWRFALQKAVTHREGLATLSAEAAIALTPYADPAKQRALWRELFDAAFA